jgi:CheY-like chemotaxis protein
MKNQKNFFIIDDDTDDQELMIEAFQELDPSIKCLSAYNGDEGLQMLRLGKVPLPDIIFVDLNMPRMGGKQLLILLKEDADLQNIPVIIYSTSSEVDEIKSLIDLGASWFLIKPSNFGELINKLREILAKLPGS